MDNRTSMIAGNGPPPHGPRLERLKPRHFSLLIALDEQRSFTRAGEALHVSQPAVSKGLAEIEDLVGVALFTRERGEIRPTAAGRVLVRHARFVKGQSSRAALDMEALKQGATETLAVGMLPSYAATVVPVVISRLVREFPRLSVRLEEGTLPTLLEQLGRGALDLVVGRLHRRIADSEFQELVLREEALSICCGPRHPLAAVHEPAWSEIERYPWIYPPSGSILRGKLEELFEVRRWPAKTSIIESASTMAGVALLALTDRLMLLPAGLVDHLGKAGQIVEVTSRLPMSHGPVGVLWHGNAPAFPARDRTIELLRDLVRTDQASWP